MGLTRHAPLRRTQIRRSTKPLPAKSAKRAAEDRPGGPREQVREATFARDGHRCVASDFVPDLPCPKGSMQCDEIQGRGRRPGSHLDLDQTQTLCWVCHHLKTVYPRLAAMLGLYGADEWLDRVGALDALDEPRWRTSAGTGPTLHDVLATDLAEWARRKAMALGVPAPAATPPLDGVLALLRERLSAGITNRGPEPS